MKPDTFLAHKCTQCYILYIVIIYCLCSFFPLPLVIFIPFRFSVKAVTPMNESPANCNGPCEYLGFQNRTNLDISNLGLILKLQTSSHLSFNILQQPFLSNYLYGSGASDVCLSSPQVSPWLAYLFLPNMCVRMHVCMLALKMTIFVQPFWSVSFRDHIIEPMFNKAKSLEPHGCAAVKCYLLLVMRHIRC